MGERVTLNRRWAGDGRRRGPSIRRGNTVRREKRPNDVHLNKHFAACGVKGKVSERWMGGLGGGPNVSSVL